MSKKQQTKSAPKTPSLLKVLAHDMLVRQWWITLLALLLVVSAMMLAVASHQTRGLTANWQALKDEQQVEQTSSNALRLELTALSEPDRISSLAKKELGMVEVTTRNEKVISL